MVLNGVCSRMFSVGTLRILDRKCSCVIVRTGCLMPRRSLFKWCAFSLRSQNGQPNLRFLRGFRNNVSRKTLVPVEEIPGAEKGFKDLLKPLCFTVLVSGCSFAGAALWQYENLRNRAREVLHPEFQNHSHFGKAGAYRQTLNTWWNDLLPGQKLAACIIGMNVAVFALWRVVPLQSFLLTYFASSPISSAPCWSMLLSAFSHYSALHLAANMYVLWSFAPAISQVLGREQFLATYLSAAMISSFTSYVYKTFRRSRVPSLGASGAIMALIGIVCVNFPTARLSVAFVDQLLPHSFSADTAMKFLILMDATGVLLGWRFFDHAAHLGGMLFGIWYVKYGHKLIWHKREPLMMKWHELRGRWK